METASQNVYKTKHSFSLQNKEKSVRKVIISELFMREKFLQKSLKAHQYELFPIIDII